MSEATISAALLDEFYRAQTKPLAQERRNALLVVVNSGTANTPSTSPLFMQLVTVPTKARREYQSSSF